MWQPHMGQPMSIESLTYADLAGRLGTSREAARSLVRRLRLPRVTANDGTVRVNVDLSEIQYQPLSRRPPGGHRADFEALKARVERLQAEVVKRETEKSSIEAIAAGHRADFELERERSDKLMTDTLTLAAVAMSAREKAARLEGQMRARRPQFWKPLPAPTERRQAPAVQQSPLTELSSSEVTIMQSEKLDTPWCEPPLSRRRMAVEVAALVVFAGITTLFVQYGIQYLVQ